MKTNIFKKSVSKHKKPLIIKPDKQTTPYFITDLQVVREKIQDFRELLPRVELYYALKANNAPEIIECIDDLVAGYDIASLGEAQQLFVQGISSNRMLYSNPVKIPAHIAATYNHGVSHYAFDSVEEVKKLARLAPGSSVYLRLKVSDYGSKFPLSKKFGIDLMHVVDYCSLAEDAGLHVKGITFHVGSQSENIQVWETAIDITGQAIRKLEQAGINIEFIDLGGGFPADYGEPIPSIKQVAKAINRAVLKHLPESVRLFAEPGRFIVANSTTLVTSVIGREHRAGSDWLYLDVGTFQGLIEPLEMPNMKYPIKTDRNTRGYKKSFVLTGPTCDAYDTIGTDYMLPSDMAVDDVVYIGAAGAYTKVYASNFNGFQIPATYFKNDKKQGK